jgi:putative endonuclease
MGLVQSIAGRLRPWLSFFFHSPDPEENPEHALGRRGEAIAARLLRKEGYKVIYRNFKHRRGGEIDLVCRDHETLVFVEVKTRSSDEFGTPAEAVTREQQRRISRGALAWLRMLDNPDVLFRFDIVEILMVEGKPHGNVIRNAFPLSAPYRY